MLVEGKGFIAPPQVSVTVTRAELEELETVAKDRDARRGYASRADSWGRGIVSNPTLMGLVGEFCLSKHLEAKLGIKVGINLDDAPRGDGGFDLVVLGKKIQVKTRGRKGDILIRRLTEGNKIVPIEWDVAVSVTWDSADPYVCYLDGFINRPDFLEQSEYAKGRRGDWMNMGAKDEDLDSIKHMIDKFLLLRPERNS